MDCAACVWVCCLVSQILSLIAVITCWLNDALRHQVNLCRSTLCMFSHSTQHARTMCCHNTEEMLESMSGDDGGWEQWGGFEHGSRNRRYRWGSQNTHYYKTCSSDTTTLSICLHLSLLKFSAAKHQNASLHLPYILKKSHCCPLLSFSEILDVILHGVKCGLMTKQHQHNLSSWQWPAVPLHKWIVMVFTCCNTGISRAHTLWRGNVHTVRTKHLKLFYRVLHSKTVPCL